MLISKRESSVPARGLVVAIVGAAMLLLAAAVQAQSSAKLQRAYRISGTYENGKIVTLSATPLEVRLPLTVTERRLTEPTPPTGYFIELLDGNKKPLMRLRIDDPSYVLMEYGDPEKPGHIVSKEIHVAKAEFSILVPAPVGTRMISFKKVAPEQATKAAAERRSEELGVFILPSSGAGAAVRATKGGAR